MRTGEYYSKGKLLLSGEYLVLQGSKALAVPLKYGQRMLVTNIKEQGVLHWESFVNDQLWFTAVFKLENLEILSSSDENTAVFIQRLLKEAARLQPLFLSAHEAYHLSNFIEFDMNWGWGSSSSLVSNLAYWLELDLLKFYKSLFNGSGYDVFCSRTGKPMVYRLIEGQPEMHPVSLNPAVTDGLYFVYLGNKQDSQLSVSKFRDRTEAAYHEKQKISEITEEMASASDLMTFMQLMRSHEEIMSDILELPMVKKEKFPDFDGEVKSLGAWGGDFIMLASHLKDQEIKAYFLSKNLSVLFKWEEIVHD